VLISVGHSYIYSGVIANYPKRTDLWHLYIDKEVKRSNIESARRLLDRMICTKLSVKNMKNTFKKFLKVSRISNKNAEPVVWF
jgi:rRNA biogenesis protein RRP5